MTYLEHTSFDKQKKSPKNTLLSKISTYLNDPSDNTFKFDLVTERDVAYIIHNLKNKKSYGHDYLSNILLKRAQATLVKPLTFLINRRYLQVYFQEN